MTRALCKAVPLAYLTFGSCASLELAMETVSKNIIQTSNGIHLDIPPMKLINNVKFI